MCFTVQAFKHKSNMTSERFQIFLAEGWLKTFELFSEWKHTNFSGAEAWNDLVTSWNIVFWSPTFPLNRQLRNLSPVVTSLCSIAFPLFIHSVHNIISIAVLYTLTLKIIYFCTVCLKGNPVHEQHRDYTCIFLSMQCHQHYAIVFYLKGGLWCSCFSEVPVSELSLELLLLQVVLPALLEQGHTRQWLKNVMRGWAVAAAFVL